ncbi:MAG: hypothetical protein U9R41_05645 [Candidatus Marinimicrobia bacterium]|nr:hypothetical protein [Candidatus Neomarinimicrobiota bacterium]
MNTLLKNIKFKLIGFLLLFSLILNLTAQENSIDNVREKADAAYDELDSTMKAIEQQNKAKTLEEKNPNIIEYKKSSYDSLSANQDSIDDFNTEQPIESPINDTSNNIQTSNNTQNDSKAEEKSLSKREKKYLTKLRMKKKHRQRLITLDKSDIIFSRKTRTSISNIQNPANIGIKAETLTNLSLIVTPIPNISFNVWNSSFSVNTVNTYFNDGRLLTQDELDDFVSLFKTDGLGLKTNIELPSIFSVKLPLVFSSFFINVGAYVSEKGTLPGEVLAIPFQGNRTPGLSFNNPLTDAKSDFEVSAYGKATFGLGSFYSLPNIKSIELPDLRFGFNINMYSGLYASVKARNITISIDEETGDSFGMDLIITAPLDTFNVIAGDTLSDVSIAEPNDLTNIAQISTGFDFGVGMRFHLNEYIPIEMPSFLKNDLDIQLSFQDIGAKLKTGNMIKKELSVSGTYLDPENIDIDSIMVFSETTIDSAFTYSENISSKMNMIFTYQPIDQIFIKTGFTSFLNKGIGYEDRSRLFISFDVFPVKWFFLNYKVERIENNKHFQTGFGFLTKNWDASFYIHSVNEMGFVGYNFSESYVTASENIKGLGISLYSNWYF